MHRESGQAKGERIAGAALRQRKWSEQDLQQLPKSGAAKLEPEAQLRRETTLTTRQIPERLHLRSRKSLNNKLYLHCKRNEQRKQV